MPYWHARCAFGGCIMNSNERALAGAVAPTSHRYREIIDASRRWSISQCCWLPPDLVALTIAASTLRDERSDVITPDDAAPGGFWTRQTVNALLMRDLPEWCAVHGVSRPYAFPEALWRYFDFLVATGRLHPGSDPLEELRRPLRCYGQLGPSGRWEPDDINDPGPCVCYERYLGPTHGDGMRLAGADTT